MVIRLEPVDQNALTPAKCKLMLKMLLSDWAQACLSVGCFKANLVNTEKANLKPKYTRNATKVLLKQY